MKSYFNNQEKNRPVEIEITIFKYLIYIFLIIVSYKWATAIAVSYGFFPKDQMPGLAIVILAPLIMQADVCIRS